MSDGVWEAARSVRYYLPQLLGPAADEVDKEIAEILTSPADSGNDEARLREVLESQDETKAFLRAVLDDDPLYRPPQARRDVVKSPGFSPLPGQIEPPMPPRFRCPIANDYTWYQLSVGEEIEVCPAHGCVLVPD
jgi:hypothetical protein